MSMLVVAALYKFFPWSDYAAHKPTLEAVCSKAGVCGTLLLAHEGINGTIAGPRDGVDAVLNHIRAIPGAEDLDHKESHADTAPFHRMKVRLKREIVTMGEPGIDPNEQVGVYVDPNEWNALITDPDTVVIDTRNAYETGIGMFEGALAPKTETFRDFPAWFRQFRAEHPHKKIAMYCTGGIRCEKATALALADGADSVFHLKGGILKYLETVAEADSLWRGECFVFDQRVSVRHGLALGQYDQCHACRRPISAADKASPAYVPGVSCPACVDHYTPADKDRFAERQRQVELAEARGEEHIGDGVNTR